MGYYCIMCTFWIAGEGDLSHTLRKRAEELPWRDKIRFLGYLHPEELRNITRQAFAGLNLVSNEGRSYYLSLSNKFFDYIHAGKPQITMDYPEYRKLNDRYDVAMLLPDLDVAGLRDAMQTMLTEKELYDRLARNTQPAATELNWQEEQKRLIAFYAPIR